MRYVVILLLAAVAAFFCVDPYVRLEVGGLKVLTLLLSPGLNAVFWPVVFLLTMRKKIGIWVCRVNLSVGFGYIVAKVVKCLSGRPRPFVGEEVWQPLSLTNGYHSFPSGHAVIAMAICACLATRYPRFKVLFLMLGVILAMIRFVTNKHYLSDVLVGCALGLLMTLFFVDRKVEIVYIWFLKLFGVKHDKYTPSR